MLTTTINANSVFSEVYLFVAYFEDNSTFTNTQLQLNQDTNTIENNYKYLL